MQTTEQPMTLEEFDALPESLLPCQLIEGKLVMAPAPTRLHQRLVWIISGELYAFLRDHPELGEAYHAPFDVQLRGPNVYQPDVMFFNRDHLDRLTEKRAQGAPDLAVEVLSPKTAHYDRNEKRLGYAQNGVAELWIIDPKRKIAEVYRLAKDASGPSAVFKRGDVLTTSLLPGFKLALDRLFGDG